MKLKPEHTGASSTKLLGWSCRIATIAHLVIISHWVGSGFLLTNALYITHDVNHQHVNKKNVQSPTKTASKTREPTGFEDIIPVPSVGVVKANALQTPVFQAPGSICFSAKELNESVGLLVHLRVCNRHRQLHRSLAKPSSRNCVFCRKACELMLWSCISSKQPKWCPHCRNTAGKWLQWPGPQNQMFFILSQKLNIYRKQAPSANNSAFNMQSCKETIYIQVTCGTSALRSVNRADRKVHDFMASHVCSILLLGPTFLGKAKKSWTNVSAFYCSFPVISPIRFL